MSDLLPYLSEHEAPQVSTTPPLDYDPSPEERKLIRKIEKMFERAKAARPDSKWLDWYKMFRGKQWGDNRPTYRHSEVFNLIFQTIQSQIPIITDSKPKFEYLGREPGDQDFAEIMNDIAASEWDSKNYLFTMTEIIYEAYFYGTGASDLTYDDDAYDGEGGICYKAKDLFYFFPDPDAKSLHEDCDFVIYAEPMPVARAKRLYKDKAKYIKSDTKDLLNATKNDLSPHRKRSPVSDRLIVEGSSLRLAEDDDKVTILTCYHRDSETIETDRKDEETGETVFETRLKYPGMRKTVIGNGIVLADMPNEYDDNKFPYQRLVNYILPHEFWGISEIEQLEGPQKTFNKLVSFVMDVLMLMGNPIWIMDSTSGIDPYNLTNAPGLIIEKKPGTEVRRETGVQLQPYVLEVISMVKQWHDQIGGSQDITRGVTSGGVTAASAIEDLQNAAQTRIRQKSRNLDSYLQMLGTAFASRVMQFYTAPKVFRLTEKDGSMRYFRAHFKQNPETGRPIAVIQRYTENNIPAEINEYELSSKLDLRVTTGTSLSFSKTEKRKELEALYDRGIIDTEEFLKSIDYPNYQAVLERKAQREQQAAAVGQPPQQ